MQIVYDFENYKDKYGFYQLEPKQTSDNGVLFSTEALICMLADDSIDDVIKTGLLVGIQQTFNKCYNGDSIANQTRYPGDTAYDSMDNYTARLTFTYLLNKRIPNYDHFAHAMKVWCFDKAPSVVDTNDPNSAKTFLLAKIVGFGKVRYAFNAMHPGQYCFTSWWGRSPALLGLMDIVADNRTSWFRNVSLAVGQFLGSFTPTNNLDGRTLSYVSWQVLKDRNRVWKFLYKLWVKKLMKQYPNGMQTVYAQYFSDKNHPIIKYSKAY